MTENEIREYIVNECQNTRCQYLRKDNECVEDGNCFEVKRQILAILEEIQQYRAIGTVEDIADGIKQSEEEFNMLMEYLNIGTIEEFKALKEKSVAKKPLCVSIAKDKDKNVGNVGRCPCCNDIVAEDMLWCDECGQKLDWQ